MSRDGDGIVQKYCIVYVRVSAESQIGGYSLDSQVELCTKKATELGYIVVKVFREEGVSAQTTDRPQLQELLSFCKNKLNNISAVFIYSYSRLSRNTVNFLTLKGLLAKSGIQIISYTEPSGDDPEGNFISTVLSAIAQYENESRGRNIANSLRKRFLEGHITSKPPIGYFMAKESGSKASAIKDPETFDILQSFWYRIDKEKLSLETVARELNAMGVRSKHDKRFKTFRSQSISKIFSNKFYMGVLVSEKYGEIQGKHESMVDEETFYRVRAIITGRKPHSKKHYALREDFALRGLLMCPDCLAPTKMSSSWQKKHRYPMYYCQTRGIHKGTSYARDVVEPKFLELLKTVRMKPNHMKHIAELLREKYVSKARLLNSASDKIRTDIQELKAALKVSRGKNAKGIYSDEEYLEMKDDYKTQIAVKESLLAEKRIDLTNIDIVLEFICYYMSNLDKVFVKATPEGRLKIGGSIFPNGVVFENGAFRTPQLGRGYKLTRDFITTPTKFGEPYRIRTCDQLLKRQLLYR